MLLVDHKLDEVHPIADKLTVIRNGELVSSGNISDYSHSKFIRDMTGHDISHEKYRPEKVGENILTVEHLSRNGAYDDISFTLDRGDIVGITGLLGSGRSEIGKALFGLCPAQSGKITLCGKKIKLNSISDAVKNKIAYVPEDRLTQGVFSDKTVRENVVVSSLKNYFENMRLDYRKMKTDAKRSVNDLGIVCDGIESRISSLSGGNAQKVVISKWLNTLPRLLILNGPTVGVDVGAKAEIHTILRDLAKRGVGIVMITDDLPELTENCNKILIVRKGRIVLETDNTISKRDIADMLICEKEDEKDR